MNTGIYNNYCKPGKTGVVGRQFHGSEEGEKISEPNHDLNTGPSIDSLLPTELQTWMLHFLIGDHMTQL